MAQFGCLAILAFTGPIIASSPILLVLEILGLLLGVWAIMTMRIGNFNVVPDVVEGGLLITHGPYKLIRHPMYVSVLLMALAVVLDQPTFFRLVVWFALLATLIIKLLYEEGLVCSLHPGYADYMRRTKRLIPFLF